MFTKMLLTVFIVFALIGCVRFQKPVSRPQETTLVQSENYTAEAPEVNEAPAQKAFTGKLSPKKIQTALKNAGYYTGAIDGKIGHKTRAAIKKFQTVNNLKADGVVGKKTTAALSTYLTQ